MHLNTVSGWTMFATAALAASNVRTTFYGGNVNGGTCSFSGYTLPSHIDGTALSGASWANSGNCGACLRVTGPAGNSITAMVVDKCPECPSNGLDLFQNGFEQLADASKGVIQTSWQWVSCGIKSPLQVRIKEGSSANWFSAQVINANVAVTDLQVSTDGGKTWKGGLQRQDYNYFERSSGFGTSSVAIRAIGSNGGSAIAKNVAVTGGNLVTADKNF